MKRYLALAASAMGLLGLASPAGASGDYGCSPRWTLFNGGYGCNDSAVLAPGNDSRVNLYYLLRDRQGAGTAGLSYAPASDDEDLGSGHNFLGWGGFAHAFYRLGSAGDEEGTHAGSRCISLASGDEAFAGALQANRGVSAADRAALVSARGLLGQTCGSANFTPTWPAIVSGAGREYLGYLRAADAFYAGRWDEARGGFGKLKGSRDPWLAETAAYMLPRTELNAAQAATFDDYGWFDGPDKVDQAALGRAGAGFADYLKRYGKGRYVDSARGLARRLLWLGGDVAGLSREYERMLATTPVADAAALALVQEIDNKLLVTKAREAADGPLLLATIDLMMMRQGSGDGDGGDGAEPVITAAQVAAQEPRFAGRADLFGFVQANHAFYVAKDMRRVLTLIPDRAKQAEFTPLQFSRQVLRGQALGALKDRNEAGFWRDMLGGAKALYQRPVVELALALSLERSGRLGEVFAAHSPIGERPIREILLAQVAGPDLLRAQARRTDRPQHERDVALFALLHKQLLYGNYAGFLGDLALVRGDAPTEGGTWDLHEQRQVPVGLFRSGRWGDEYSCAPLARLVTALSRNPRDARALLCLGDFYRINGFDSARWVTAPKADELGGTEPLFAGQARPRSALYDAVIADPAAGANEKAYALYRAIHCYAPSGTSDCSGTEVAKSQRQAWFQRLKRDYPGSEWAKKLRYYW